MEEIFVILPYQSARSVLRLKMNRSMRRFVCLMPVILLMASCGSQKNKSATDSVQLSDADTAACASIEGEWLLEHVVVSDTLEVRPAEVSPDARLVAYFYSDGTFNFQTGCNAIGGNYVQTGDSIKLSNMLWTEMACEDMRVEELLRSVLPEVVILDWNNDSILRLNTESSAYVLLQRCGDGL